jgi:hypothetical protein
MVPGATLWNGHGETATVRRVTRPLLPSHARLLEAVTAGGGFLRLPVDELDGWSTRPPAPAAPPPVVQHPAAAAALDELPHVLRLLRLGLGSSQADVAAAVGVSGSALSDLETGRAPITAGQVRRWAAWAAATLAVEPEPDHAARRRRWTELMWAGERT